MRVSHRVICAGSPGWMVLNSLKIFSRVKELIPDAELHLFLTGEPSVPKNDDLQVVYAHRAMLAEGALLAARFATIHKRSPLPKDFAEAAVWIYPAHRAEFYSHPAVLSQLHGAIPVFNPIGAALRDVFAGIPIQGISVIDRMTRMRFAYETARLLADETLQEQTRVPMMAEAKVRFKELEHGLLPWDERARVIKKADSIQGWMTEDELAWLILNAEQADSVVEIGSWRGRSTYALLSSCKGTVTAIDHWQGGRDEPDHIKREASSTNLYEAFRNNVGHFKNLTVLKMPSLEATKHVEGADMVFIDGGHGYEEVRDDIRAWKPRTRKMICGHDYNWDTVRRAVADELGPVGRGPGSIWYKVIKREAANVAA